MHEKVILPLKSNEPLFYNKDKLEALKEELEEFLSDKSNSYMNNKDFAKKFMGIQEIQSNNSVEGYNDDVKKIISVTSKEKNSAKGEHIITNLYNGYNMILGNPEINKENLKKLYDILSEGLLSVDDKNNMGNYYRMAPVYIYFSRVMWAKPDEGVPYELINEHMESLFSYLNDNSSSLSATDNFIKSQIAHYYFVYVHPYFDVNGRTSRTVSMWHLLNNKAYPYIIFNRAIPLTLKTYYKIIREVKLFNNATFFLNYMLGNVKLELEKESVISSIEESIKGSITPSEYQTLLYILSLNGLKTCKDFASFYNRINEKTPVTTIRDEMLMPLIDKNVLKVVRKTDSHLNDGTSNFVFDLNRDFIDNDPVKIKRLKI